ncbi:uncharacterized protein LOC135101468 [Scylla paramamosain]|uniref:uncharacterized protein LOC135101468 n=1 Tax=Scylla paramamosain TaxID=85552 RepID=UPI003083340D
MIIIAFPCFYGIWSGVGVVATPHTLSHTHAGCRGHPVHLRHTHAGVSWPSPTPVPHMLVVVVALHTRPHASVSWPPHSPGPYTCWLSWPSYSPARRTCVSWSSHSPAPDKAAFCTTRMALFLPDFGGSTLGEVMVSLGQLEASSKCLQTAIEMEAKSPILPFTSIPFCFE